MEIPVTVEDNHSQSYLTCPDSHHPHLIDLGLPSGTKWACCNVGANTPEDYGNYYAWGETETKSKFIWSTYIHCDGSESTCHNLGSDIARTDYDVAYVKWGGFWMMPSNTQHRELLDNCISTWTTQNGVDGRLFTGTNGGSIFLPATGLRLDTDLYDAGTYGCYWSSTQYKSDGYGIYYLDFSPGDVFTNSYGIGCSWGLSVRPVIGN